MSQHTCASGSQPVTRSLPLLAVLLVSLTACAAVEPSARVQVNTVQSLSSADAVTCAAASVQQLARSQPKWNLEAMKGDAALGTLETGHFAKTNVLGIRTQLTYHPDKQQFSGKIKASGPYFSDLGAKKAAADLEALLAQCR